MRYLSIGCAIVLIALGISSSLSAGPILDQSYIDEAGYYSFSTPVAQTFTVGVTGKLVRVELLLGRDGNVGSFGSDPILFIQKAAGGRPDFDGARVAARTFSAAVLPDPIASGVYTSFDFSGDDIPIEVGEQFAIIVDSRGPSLNWGMGPQSVISYPYPGGTQWAPNDTQGAIVLSGPLGVGSFDFKTFVEPIPEPSGIAIATIGGVLLLAVNARRKYRRHA